MPSHGPSVWLATRDRRVLVSGLGAIALLLGATRGVPAWRRWRADELANVGEVRAERARATREVRMASAVRDSGRARATQLADVMPGLLPGAAPSVAGVRLGEIVTETGTESGVRTGAIDVTVDTTIGGPFLRVRVRTDAVGDVRGLTDWLVALETRREWLLVRELNVTQAEPVSVGRPEALRASVVVEALARRPVPDNGRTVLGAASVRTTVSVASRP